MFCLGLLLNTDFLLCSWLGPIPYSKQDVGGKANCSQSSPGHQLHWSITSLLNVHASRMLSFYFSFFICVCVCVLCMHVCICVNAHVWMCACMWVCVSAEARGLCVESSSTTLHLISLGQGLSVTASIQEYS